MTFIPTPPSRRHQSEKANAFDKIEKFPEAFDGNLFSYHTLTRIFDRESVGRFRFPSFFIFVSRFLHSVINLFHQFSLYFALCVLFSMTRFSFHVDRSCHFAFLTISARFFHHYLTFINLSHPRKRK